MQLHSLNALFMKKIFLKDWVLEDYIWILVGISDICFQIGKDKKKMHVLLNRYLALCQRSLRNGKFKSRQSSNISA